MCAPLASNRGHVSLLQDLVRIVYILCTPIWCLVVDHMVPCVIYSVHVACYSDVLSLRLRLFAGVFTEEGKQFSDHHGCRQHARQ